MFSPCDLCWGVSLSAQVYLRTREQFFSSPFAHRSFTNGSVWPAFSGYIKYNLPFIIGSLYYRVVVIRAPLQGLCYTVRDAVDWLAAPTNNFVNQLNTARRFMWNKATKVRCTVDAASHIFSGGICYGGFCWH